MKNSILDLNNYLFEQIERLNDDDLTDEELDREIKRSTAITKVSNSIIQSGNLALKAQKRIDDMGGTGSIDMSMLGVREDGKC